MRNSRDADIAHWAARLVTVGILAMGSLPKFTGGSAALADKLPGGATSVLLIGVVEVIAIVLILVPRTTMIGSAIVALSALAATWMAWKKRTMATVTSAA